jgi:hypothetical protein
LNVILLSTLEKREGESPATTAQLTIGEMKGVWSAVWSEASETGKPRHDTWYDGPSWEDLLLIFRTNVGEKLTNGFRPLLNIPWDPAVLVQNERTRHILMLQYYSESHPNEAVYESLRIWRREQSGKEHKAPYMVASNRMLRMVSVFLPRTVEELMQIPGFGELKGRLYGNELVSLTAGQERYGDFPLFWVAGETDPSQFEQWLETQREQKAKLAGERQLRKRQLLEALAGGAGLEQLQRDTSMLRRELIQWIEELDKEGYSVEQFVETELSLVDEEVRETAAGLFQSKGDRYLKPILQELYSEEELASVDVDYVYAWLRLLRLQKRKQNGGVAENNQVQEQAS